ncbi:hypothetical protein CLV98_10554 [Dyadobacter jejuensis]|uniref:Uncharacterized protein n=1 Tax=Dyadobacter jejuensis TaxID=1082580 RepID=A0A316ALE2_9BACT|nr:hypothetical protein [Dyadobacter jejuensis]PWJ57874.1 hypothetical protein CLV98_10554 [Dyadobacter jejuensis]
MKNISSLFLGMAILCSFGSVLAQSNTSLPIFNTCEEATQYAFRDLDQTKITKGILYDRVFKNAHLELFQSAENSHAGHWKQAYFELYHASNNNSQMLNSDNLDNLIYESYESTLTVTLGVLAAEFNVLNYDVVETTSTGSPYRPLHR